MSISPIALAPVWLAQAGLDAHAPNSAKVTDTRVSPTDRPISIVRPEPQPGDSADFLRTILDDVHPSAQTAKKGLQAALADSIAGPHSKTDAERHAEQMDRRSELREARKVAQARREAVRDEALKARVGKRREAAHLFREVRAEAREQDELLDQERDRELLEFRAGIDARLKEVVRDGSSDSGSEMGIFPYAESSFGDQFELSWLGSQEADANPAASPSPEAEAASPGGLFDSMS